MLTESAPCSRSQRDTCIRLEKSRCRRRPIPACGRFPSGCSFCCLRLLKQMMRAHKADQTKQDCVAAPALVWNSAVPATNYQHMIFMSDLVRTQKLSTKKTPGATQCYKLVLCSASPVQLATSIICLHGGFRLSQHDEDLSASQESWPPASMATYQSNQTCCAGHRREPAPPR